jgi:predicted Abi (CAAX) family protease
VNEAHRQAMLQRYLAAVRERIREHGWVIQGVVDPADGAAAEPMAYTVGLTDAGLPELWLPVAPLERGAVILNRLARQSLAEELVPGKPYQVEGLPGDVFTVQPVDPVDAATCLVMAFNLYGPQVSALQVVAADA